MKKELENLCNDFSNAHQLIDIMSKGAIEQSTFNEMTYALDFVADALKAKVDAFYLLIESMEEDR